MVEDLGNLEPMNVDQVFWPMDTAPEEQLEVIEALVGQIGVDLTGGR